MFVAPPSREDRRDVLLQAVRDIHFAAVVVAPGGVFASSHLPLLVKETGNGDVLLEGHVSRANDLWRQSRDTPALAIFQGPQAYIHPGWYPSKQRDGRAVPTWNYIAVHLTGVISANEDETWLRRHLEELTAANESGRAEPWAIDDAPPEYVAALIKGVVGLQIRVETIEGNWKMGQRQPLENRLGAAQGLAASPHAADQQVAAAMTAALAEDGR